MAKRKPNTSLEGESKADRFHRLGKVRMDRALARIRQVGNLAGPNYAYTLEEAELIINTLLEAVGKVSDAFLKRPTENAGFKFPEPKTPAK